MARPSCARRAGESPSTRAESKSARIASNVDVSSTLGGRNTSRFWSRRTKPQRLLLLELTAAFQKNCQPDFTAADCVHLVPIELPDYFKKWIIGFKNNKIVDWFLVGLFAGFGFLSKYLFIYLALGVDIFLIYMIYKKKIDFKCLVSLIPFLIVLLPHLIWLTENNYITLTYGLDRTGTGDQNLLDHIMSVPTFTRIERN